MSERDQIFNIYLIFIALVKNKGGNTQREANRVRGTRVSRMKEDVLCSSENCERIKRKSDVSEDRARGKRVTNRLE